MNLNKDALGLKREFLRRKETLSLAESCTGGRIASAITAIPGSSQYFYGGVVSYANSAKTALLGVHSSIIKKVGAVSPEVALAMAKGAKNKFKTTWAVSVTGIAGPHGGTMSKPIGLVFFGVAGPGVHWVLQHRFVGNRKTIQEKSTKEALSIMLEILKES
jgi:PncC family amidohydrolase